MPFAKAGAGTSRGAATFLKNLISARVMAGYFRLPMAQRESDQRSEIPRDTADCAGAVVFLCSPAARHLTGDLIVIDVALTAAPIVRR